MKIIFKLIICLWAIFHTDLSKAQNNDLKKAEKDLLSHLKKINYWVFNPQYNEKIHSGDSIAIENGIFRKKLNYYTSRFSGTIKYDFSELQKEGLTIATSDDGLFRIYSWDTWTGGTMHYFDNIFQFKINDRVMSLHYDSSEIENNEDDPKSWYEKIYSLKFDNKTIYIGVYNAIFSSKDAVEGIKLFEIIKNGLNDTIKLIKTKSGLHNELSYEYNFFSVVDMKERPTISYDKASKTIYLPLVQEDGTVTKKFIKYKFTRKYFEKIK
jgi:hypothetical protein